MTSRVGGGVRVIAGRWRGVRLATPRDRELRPTAERAREAVFAILEHGLPRLQGARFLDLFAGTGAIGLEALSRGAALALMVEQAPETGAIIRRNLEKLGEPEGARLLLADAARLPPAPHPFELVFLDPPYRSGLAVPALAGLGRGWLAPDARIVVELATREDLELPRGFTLERERRYGAAKFLFLRRGEGA